jgi:hypothetical protein
VDRREARLVRRRRTAIFYFGGKKKLKIFFEIGKQDHPKKYKTQKYKIKKKYTHRLKETLIFD